MWSNFMRFVDDEGLSVGELKARAGLSNAAIDSQLTRMEKWWGYIVVEPDAADCRSRPPRVELVVRPTPAGRRAREVWQPLFGEIETRWRLRFGENAVDGLRGSLEAVVGQLDATLPHALPLGGIEAIVRPEPRVAARHGEGIGTLDLSVLLSQALLAFTIDFERESEISLALSANALRVLGESGVPLRDLPRLTGVSREAIAVSVRILERREYIVVEPDPARGRSRSARLTPKGRSAQEASRRFLAVVEERWEGRFGTEAIARLRAALQGLFDQHDGGEPRLSQGLEPHPTGWRARKPFLAQTTAVLRDPRSGLPHYPVVSHRGGFPDGS
jgi:DNA-binding MarR family transcriptional regulator